MFKTVRFLTITLLLVFTISESAASSKIKFGKINKEHLQITECPIDSNAHAYYIFDKGSTNFIYSSSFKLSYKRHFRIKILDETALDEASFEIPLYNSRNGSEERITNIKAYTHNLEDGKIISSKLDRNNIIREQKSDHWDIVKFALPNVKKGSVIEVQYSISSDFWFNLSGWQFQYRIPVLKTNYRVEIPEYYIYKQFPHGYVSYNTERSTGRGLITVGNDDIDFQNEIFEYSAENVPAFPIGEHLTTIDNYITSVEFELSTIDFPNSMLKNYATSWSKINQRLLESISFGERLKKDRCFNEPAEQLNALATTEADKMQAAFSYIKSRTKWNNHYSIYTSQSFNKTLETGLGNVSDINLSLVALMRTMGLKADPIVLSTRSNGFVFDYRPSSNKLNYVIASCTIDDEIYILDATNDWSGVNMIPTRCLNGNGLMVVPDKVTWVPLSSGAEYKTSNTYSLTLNDDGVFTGHIVNRYYEYASYIERNKIKNKASRDKYLEDIEKENAGLTLNESKIQNVDSLHKNVSEQHSVDIKHNVEIMGDLMIFTPTLFDAMKSNPLKLENRLYPVEYYFPENTTCKVIIQIPENYEVESLPESIMYQSPSGVCQFKYLLSKSATTISIVSHYERNQTIFPQSQYNELKQFYEAIVTKQNEKIVLKKKASIAENTPIASNDE